MVRDLQRELRRRGIRIRVDGQYGRSTRAGVRILQRRMKLRATGRADAKLLRRLGIQLRAVASSPPSAGLGSQLAPATGARYLRTFPVQGEHTYFDDFGAPRGSHTHQGNDVMAAKGTPVVAVADGVIDRLTRVETGLGGIWIWLKDGEGNTFYYAHLDSIAPLLEEGTAVAVGQVIGNVGNTGDARYGADHLHFEIHPGGGGAIDPFTELLAVDPNPPTRR
jgi:murein DD-endopeptidase MepM/ murein hydrolase activator NlpD